MNKTDVEAVWNSKQTWSYANVQYENGCQWNEVQQVLKAMNEKKPIIKKMVAKASPTEGMELKIKAIKLFGMKMKVWNSRNIQRFV